MKVIFLLKQLYSSVQNVWYLGFKEIALLTVELGILFKKHILIKPLQLALNMKKLNTQVFTFFSILNIPRTFNGT